MNQSGACDLSRLAAGNARRLRKERDWSMAEMAAAVGVSRALIAGIERGDRNLTLRVLAKVAVALEVDPADLLGPGSGRALRVDVYVPPGMSSQTVTEVASRKLGLFIA